MNLWYNPALKTNKRPLVHAVIRSVNYPGIISYSSKALTLELPLVGTDTEDDDNSSFMNFGAGLSSDASGDGSLSVSSAMMTLSYALQLNDDHTWLAIGFQGAYTFTRMQLPSYNYYPDQFDQYGPIASAIAADPTQSGNTYSYFNDGVGLALFHTGAQKQWYIGGSIRHVNQPFTSSQHAIAYQVPMSRSIQAGYTTAISSDDAIGGYGVFNWQGVVHEHLIGVRYTHNLNDSATNTVSFGAGYRLGDALIPDVGCRLGANRFGVCYEINVSSGSYSNYNRKSFDIYYRRDL